MATETDDSRLGRLEGQMEQVIVTLQEMRQDIRAVNSRIDRLFLSTWAIGGGIIATLLVQMFRGG